MAKKVTFLLVFLLVLLLASVTAFATGTDSTAPETSFTEEEKADLPPAPEEGSVAYYEKMYGTLFFDPEAVSNEGFLVNNIIIKRLDNSQLRHVITGTVVSTSSAVSSVTTENAVVMLMYIKVDDQYVPLFSMDSKELESTNKIEGKSVLASKVDLKYLGSDKVNDIRLVAFKKGEKELVLNENLQITNLQIVVRNWTIERVKAEFNQFWNALQKTSP